MARTNNSIRNIIFAFGTQAISILTNFAIRTIMIRYLGNQAVSLNGLFTEVLSVLSLTELGVGSAIIYNLYKPLANNDREKVRQLMGLFKTAYRVIAGATLMLGVAVCPFLHLLVNSLDYSMNYVRAVYLLFVVDLSVSYLFSYKLSLLNADQKNYVTSRINMWMKLVGAGVKIAVLIFAKEFIAFLIVSIAITLIGNIIGSVTVDNYYPWLKESHEKLPTEERKEVFANIKNLFIKALSGKITNSTDNMLISALVNTLQVGIYSNYSLIIGIFRQVANQIAYGGLTASLGNLLVTEKEEKCVTVFRRLLYLFYIIAAMAAVGTVCCIDLFVEELWIKQEEYVLGTGVVFVCCLNLFMEIVHRPLWAIMEVSGLFRQDKYVSITGSIVNLIVSIALGLKIGMAGIFIGTFLTYAIQAVLKAKLLYEKRFGRSPWRYYLVTAGMFAGMLLQMAVSYWLCSLVRTESCVAEFLLRGVISVAVTGGSILLVTFKTEAFSYYLRLAKSMVTKKAEK